MLFFRLHILPKEKGWWAGGGEWWEALTFRHTHRQGSVKGKRHEIYAHHEK